MHARVTTISGGSPDRLQEGIADFQSQVVPAVKEMGGGGAILLVDRGSGEALGITLWPDEAALRASEERANELRRGVTEQMNANEPQVARYEAAVFETF
ncbi:MAG: hypothetical protein WBB76_07015 [Gaiellaceae bacterium]